MALHWDWHFKLVDNETGKVEKDFWRKNMVHDDGEQLLLQGIFSPLGTLATVIEEDLLYDQTGHADGEKCLHAASVGGSAFADVSSGDYIYLVGGTDNEVSASTYEVSSVGADAENALLKSDPYAGDVTGGVVALRNRRLLIALDTRTDPSETDTIGQMEAYEEDGAGYSRSDVDPHNTSNWTISRDSDSGDYRATSATVSFKASGTGWQPNYNASLVAYTGAIGNESNETLIATCPFGDDGPITVGNGKTFYTDIYVSIGEG